MATIGYKDIFADDIFSPVIQSANELLQKLTELEGKLRALGKSYAAAMKEGLDSGDIQKIVQGLSGLNAVQAQGTEVVKQRKAAEGELAKMQKQLETIQKQLAAAESELAKEIEKARQALSKRKAEVKDLVAAERVQATVEKALRGEIEDSFQSYKELVGTLADLKAAYKDLAAQGLEGTEDAKKLKALIDDLDDRVKSIDKSVGEFQRLVGSYKESIVQALQEVAVVSVNVGTEIEVNIGTVLPLLKEGFLKAGEAAIKGGLGIAAFGNAIKILGATLRQAAILIVLDGLVRLFQALAKWATEFSERQKIAEWAATQERILKAERQIAFVEYQLLLARGEAIGQLRKQAEWTNELRLAEKELYQAKLAALATAEKELQARKGLIDDAEKLREYEEKRADLARQRIELEFGYKRRNAELAEQERQIQETINKKYRELSRTLMDLTARGNEYAAVWIEAAKNITDLQERQRELLKEFEGDAEAQARIRAGFQRAIAAVQADAQREFAQALRELRSTLSDELAKLTATEYTLTIRQIWREAAEAAENYLDTAKKLREDAQSPYVPQARRSELVQLANEYEKLAKQVKDASLVRIQKEFAAQLDSLREKLVGYETDKVKAVQFRFDTERKAFEAYIKDLQAALDTEIERRRAAGLQTKELEDIKTQVIAAATEYRILLAQREAEETAEAQKQMVAERMREVKELRDLATERIETETELQRKSIELYVASEKERERRLSALAEQDVRRRIEIEERYLQQLQKLYAETQNELVQREIERVGSRLAMLDMELANLAKQRYERTAKEIGKSIERVSEAIDMVLDRADQARLRKLDAEQRILEKRLDILRAAAEAGALSLEDSLALTEKQLEDMEKRRRAIEERIQRRQAFISALQAYSAALQQTGNPMQALTQSITNLSLLRAFVSSLPTFYEGTERVSSENAAKIQGLVRDAFVVRVHEGERIVPAHINKQLGGVRNEDLPKLVRGTEVSVRYDSVADTIVEVLRRHNKIQTVRRSL